MPTGQIAWTTVQCPQQLGCNLFSNPKSRGQSTCNGFLLYVLLATFPILCQAKVGKKSPLIFHGLSSTNPFLKMPSGYRHCTRSVGASLTERPGQLVACSNLVTELLCVQSSASNVKKLSIGQSPWYTAHCHIKSFQGPSGLITSWTVDRGLLHCGMFKRLLQAHHSNLLPHMQPAHCNGCKPLQTVLRVGSWCWRGGKRFPDVIAGLPSASNHEGRKVHFFLPV